MGDLNFRQIDTVYGFYHMEINGLGDVDGNQEIFLRRPDGTYFSLGTRDAIEARVGPVPLIGPPPAFLPLGNFGTPVVDDNLFIRIQPDAAGPGMAPIAGGRSRHSRKYRARKRSRRSRKR